ncbi:MAG: hypothetical protein OXT67_04210 [Zetaproteobacteria bacterium]|nr:hypothetical protein [Zetaproteobacteria bacterium]
MKKLYLYYILSHLLVHSSVYAAPSYSVDQVLEGYQNAHKTARDVLKCFASVTSRIRKDFTIRDQFKVELVTQMLQKIHQHGIRPDVIAYNAAISACAEARDKDTALTLLHQMQQHNISPDAISYNGVICACAKISDAHTALTLLRQMQERSIFATVVSYSEVMSACEAGGEYQMALYLFEEMRSMNIQPDVIAYNTAMSIYMKVGNHYAALYLFAQMRQHGMQPDAISYNTLISACEQAGDRDSSLHLLDQAIQQNVYIDPLRDTMSKLDLRITQLFSPQSIASLAQQEKINTQWIYNLPKEVALMIVDEAHKQDKLAHKQIIANSPENGGLMEAVQLYLDNHGYLYKRDTHGVFDILGKATKPVLNVHAKPFTPQSKGNL